MNGCGSWLMMSRAAGTPEGGGFKRNPPIFLHHGDVVEVEIEGVGLLRNPVIDPAHS